MSCASQCRWPRSEVLFDGEPMIVYSRIFSCEHSSAPSPIFEYSADRGSTLERKWWDKKITTNVGDWSSLVESALTKLFHPEKKGAHTTKRDNCRQYDPNERYTLEPLWCVILARVISVFCCRCSPHLRGHVLCRSNTNSGRYLSEVRKSRLFMLVTCSCSGSSRLFFLWCAPKLRNIQFWELL